jgi:lysophospholipase L1-like esterase
MKKFGLLAIALIAVFALFRLSEKGAGIQVACIGDSNTLGHGLFPKAWFSYPSRLQSLLGGDYEVHNYGQAGATVSRPSADQYSKGLKFGESISRDHDYFIFMLGTNDSKDFSDDFFGEYQSLIQKYNVSSGDKVMLCTPPTAFSDGWGIDKGLVSTSIHVKIVELAEKKGYKLLDVNRIMNTAIFFQDDGIHFNDDGANHLANLLKKTLFD